MAIFLSLRALILRLAKPGDELFSDRVKPRFLLQGIKDLSPTNIDV